VKSDTFKRVSTVSNRKITNAQPAQNRVSGIAFTNDSFNLK
jgi:hypothetical protein